jgi:hypothetical protein
VDGVSDASLDSKGRSRRKFLKLAGVGIAALAGYAVLDSLGYLGSEFPIRSYINSLQRKALSDRAANYGNDGDRIAYAANYLGLGPSVISDVADSWNLASPTTRAQMGGAIPTATAAVVADEFSNADTKSLVQQYPDLAWIHAHANALFTFPWMPYVQDGDQRLTRMADLRLSEGPVEVQGQLLDLHYPENDPVNPVYYGKKRYIREGFKFLAENFGARLASFGVSDLAVISEQSTAASVTILFDGTSRNLPVKAGDTFIFADTPDVPLYSYTAVDNRNAMGPIVQEGALSLGLETMKLFRDKHPDLQDGCSLALTDQGYVQLDGIFNQDTQFSQYLYQGFYGGNLSINPVEKTISWKQYEAVSATAEQTVRGYDIETVLNYHPYFIQPLSLLQRDPSIVELLVGSPEVYVPSQWHLGHLFEKYNQKGGC